MPELPEVETIRTTLERNIVGKTIRGVDVYYEKLIKGVSVEEFRSRLKGTTIQGMGRYGKYLFFHLGELTLISHLRMEGRYYLKPDDDPVEKHEHVVFRFTDGTTLRYQDTRKFGTMELVLGGCERQAKGLCHLGLEPFDSQFDGSYLKTRSGKSKKPIKNFLLDQTKVSGLGNIYVNEVLFLSRFHPEAPVSELTKSDWQKVADASRNVLQKAIELGGTTIRTYYSDLGVSGRFQNELNVHDRKGRPCPACQTPIAKIQVGGRGTYYCPQCQKKRDEG